MTRVVYENELFAASHQECSVLRRQLGGAFRLERGGARIVGLVGQLQLPGESCLVIRSRKAGSASLLAWLAYADPTLEALRHVGRLPQMSGDQGFGDLIARVFCIETWRALQTSGLLRMYRRQRVLSAVVRGRIDFARAVRTGGDLSRTPCIVFARLPQTPLNRLLASALARLRRDQGLRAAAGSSLAPLASALADVPPLLDMVELRRPQVLSRLERPFAAAAALARLILGHGGLSEGGALSGVSLLVNVASLFEAAVRRAMRDTMPESMAKHLLRVHRVPGRRGEACDTGAPMEVDVFVPGGRVGPLVVDAKYKTDVSASNLHQMAAYCWLTGARRAILVFPAGVLSDPRSFELRPGTEDPPIRIDLAELDLSGQTLSDWRRAAQRLSDSLDPARRRSCLLL